MYPSKIDVYKLLAEFSNKLESFLEKAPFSVNFAVAFDYVDLIRFDTKRDHSLDTFKFTFSMFELTDSESLIKRLKIMLIKAGWYPILDNVTSIKRSTDTEAVDDLVKTGVDLESAVQESSWIQLHNFHVITHVNARANQLLTQAYHDDTLEDSVQVYAIDMPISILLTNINSILPVDRWRLFSQHAKYIYTYDSLKRSSGGTS
jgi:hypothetical protein